MRCPFCGNIDTQVKDSRPAEDHVSIRRRRFCPACGGRFTTYERVQLRDLVVIKSNGRREDFDRDKLGTMDTELFKEWFQAFAQNAGLTLHVENLYGTNNHHIVESCYKGLARSLRAAVTIDPRAAQAVPSTKGVLGSGTTDV